MIEVSHLTKTFKTSKRQPGAWGALKAVFVPEHGELRAVDDVSFEIQQGELVGYLGPNGAGKSTTIKMLTGILHPTSGKVRVNGFDPVKERSQCARSIGVVFGQKTQLWWDLPVGESFDLIRTIYKIPEADFKRRLEFFFDLLQLQEFLHQQTRKLSLGQRMRADLAASLLHDPQVLFLDEPTIGLDILTRDLVRSFIKELNKNKKTTILLTTHDIQDIEFLAERLILLDKGKIHYDGNIGDFVAQYANERIVTVHLEEDASVDVFNGFRVSKQESPRHFEVALPEGQSTGALIQALAEKKQRIQEIHVRKQDLGDTLKRLYAGSRNVEL
ncbi:MAG: ATP-binding cassette domain-containing protein [Spirochaetia bacterium]|nr:ATP-binding cassette domain-containing protein [Spirochaetia bacterium]